MRGLDIIAGSMGEEPDISRWAWATVTDDSPLRIRIDNEDDPLPFAPDTLVASLAVSDRVWVQLVTNTNHQRRYRRVIILGRAGG